MNGSTSTSSGSQQGAVGRGLAGVREVIDQLRNPGEQRGTGRPHRGDARAAVLVALAEGPASGYEIVRLLEERGTDGPTPTAGTVYPALQLLADEGLATATEADGRKTWTLTAAGRVAAEAEAVRERPGTPDAGTARGHGHRGAIVRSAATLVQAASLAAQSAAPDQVGEIVATLDDARRRILTVLARS